MEAAQRVTTGIRLARAHQNQLALVEALRVQAMVAVRQQHRDEAERALEEGLSLARSMPYPYAEARLLEVAAELHAQQAEPQLARERLEAALGTYRRLGARADAARCAQLLGS